MQPIFSLFKRTRLQLNRLPLYYCTIIDVIAAANAKIAAIIYDFFDVSLNVAKNKK